MFSGSNLSSYSDAVFILSFWELKLSGMIPVEKLHSLSPALIVYFPDPGR